MRVLWVVLLLVPLAGCLGGTSPGPIALFALPAIERGDPTPVPADDCADLLTMLNTRAEHQAIVGLHQSVEDKGHYWVGREVMVDFALESSSDAAAPSAPDGASARSADVTGTNNQEAGADEADIIKTDGEWTYVIRGSELWVLHSSTVGNLTEHARIKLGDGWGGQLLLVERGASPSDDRLVVIRSAPGPVQETKPDGDIGDLAARSFMPYYSIGYTSIKVYDISDRAQPVAVAEHLIEGVHVAARLIDGHAYVVVNHYEQGLGLRTWAHPDDQDLKARGLDWESYYQLNEEASKAIRLAVAQKAIEDNKAILANLTLADHLPDIFQDGQRQAYDQEACQRVLSAPDSTGRSVNTILAIDVDDEEPSASVTQMLSGHPIVYGAPDALVLASSSQDVWWFWAQPDLDEATNLHWFDLDGLDVVHRASGRVDGIVQDQFGIDVHGDELRVATTTGTWGRWWVDDPSPMMNHLVVFEEVAGVLVESGRAGPMAEGERIWSARFTDERAYIVTFEQIDPLWIIDLSGDQPEILGELEIPGVSTYIHPLSDDALLTIGIGPGEDGTGLDWSRVQVSLFDISDPANPIRSDVVDLSPKDGWSWSGATHEHKAFTYWDRLGMLAVPVSSHSYGERVWSEEQGRWIEDGGSHIALKLLTIDQEAMDIRHYGEIDQDFLLEDGQRFPGYGLDIERSHFLGFPDAFPATPVSVYALSGLGMSAHDLGSLEPQDGVIYEGQPQYEVYY